SALASGQSGEATAALAGFHDASDAIKTSGWACKTGSAQPVRVHLFARVQGTLRHVDSQLADHVRTDLAGPCAGAAHAFRFSDYASGEVGAALYDRVSPVTMEVYVEDDDHLLSPLPGTGRDVTFYPVGLW